MAIQYDAPTTKGDLEAGIVANEAITPDTLAAINQLLNITPETADELIDVAVGQYSPAAGVFFWTSPEGASDIEAVIINTSGMPAGTEVNFPEGLAESPVVIFNAEAGVKVEFNGIERVVQMGEGDDHAVFNGDADTTVDASAGNDTIITSGGDDSITTGTGNDFVRAGAGNDTIISSSGEDTIDGGTGFDSVQVNFEYDADNVIITGDVHFSDGGANSVTLDNVQFVSFSNGHTLTIMDEADQAAAMRLYQTVLGRAADEAGAEFYLDESLDIPDPSLVIAAGMLGSEEFTAKHGSVDDMDNADFVTLIYEQGLGREIDEAGLEFYMGRLEAGETKNQVAAEINDSPESREVNMDTVMLIDGWV